MGCTQWGSNPGPCLAPLESLKNSILCLFLFQNLKFVSLLHLSAIRRLVDVVDSADVESGVIAIGNIYTAITPLCS